MDKSTDVGAIVDPVQLDADSGLVAEGQKAGAVLHQADCPIPKAGSFFAPGFFTDVHPANPVAEVEIFGPVATLTTFRTPDEAVELANNTRYGLAATVWSENINLALDVASKIKAGILWINCTNMMDAGAGFGGYRESGYGREGGREGMYEYLTLPGVKAVAEAAPVAPDAAPVPGPRAMSRPSTARRRCMSAARRSGPTAAIPMRWCIRAGSWVWRALATARTSATRSRRRMVPRAGARRPGTTGRRCCITSRKT